jgi:Tfp pilus assembly protein PilN
MISLPNAVPRAAIGIEIGPHHLRAVRYSGRRSRHADAMEMEWSVDVPDDAVAALKDRFGTGNRIAIAVDVSALFLKRLALPALSPEERRQVVALDPERYFPVRDVDLVVGVRNDDLVVAADAGEFDRLTESLSALGTIEFVEPAPMALARHLAAAGATDGVIVVADPRDGEAAVASVADGTIVNVRKVPATAEEIAEAVHDTRSEMAKGYLFPWQDALAAAIADGCGIPFEAVPPPSGTTESFAAAAGARLGLGDPPTLALVSKSLQRQAAARGLRRTVLAAVTLFAAFALSLWSVDHRRERTLLSLEQRIASRQDEAALVQTLLAEMAEAEQEVATLAAVSRGRHDLLDVLLLVTQLLPPDAHLRSLHASSSEWELDGYARDAARLIPTLEESDSLADVRFRTATTRVQLNNEAYESFSLALRYVPPSQ